MSRIVDLGNPGPAQGYTAAAGPTASVGAAPSVLTSFALVSLDFTGSTDPAGGGLTYSCTLDVKPAGSASALVDATTSTPDFTPDKIGAYSGVLTVTDINGRTDTSRWFREVRSALSVSIAAVSDQLDLSAATLDSTVTGGISPYTYAWTVDGATTGLSSSTAADPTYTPTGAGTPTAVVTVTDAAGQTAKASVTWRVGDTEGFLYWIVDFSDPAYDGHDFVSTGTLTVNGETLEKSGSGSGACPAGNLVVTGGKLKVQTTAAHGLLGIGFAAGSFGGVEPVDYSLGAAFDTTLSADEDGVWAYWQSTTVIAQRHGGVQKVLAENATPTTYRYTIPGNVQPKAVESRIIGRYVFRAQYTHDALTTSTIPLPSVMSKLPMPPSGNMTRAVMPPGTGADAISSPPFGGWYCSATNSLRYDIKFIWVRWKPGPM